MNKKSLGALQPQQLGVCHQASVDQREASPILCSIVLQSDRQNPCTFVPRSESQ